MARLSEKALMEIRLKSAEEEIERLRAVLIVEKDESADEIEHLKLEATCRRSENDRLSIENELLRRLVISEDERRKTASAIAFLYATTESRRSAADDEIDKERAKAAADATELVKAGVKMFLFPLVADFFGQKVK